MYVHVGEDVMVRSSEIIAILEKGHGPCSHRNSIVFGSKKGAYRDLSNGAFKSLIIAGPQIYLSPIAPVTLKKRLIKSKGNGLII